MILETESPPAEKPYHKCLEGANPEVDGALCPSLYRVLNDSNYAKGLCRFILTQLQPMTGKQRLAGIIYRTSSKDNGVLLNYCFFCGNSLQPLLNAPYPEEKPIMETPAPDAG